MTGIELSHGAASSSAETALVSSSADPSSKVSDCSLAELEAQITELAGHLNAANHRWLMLIAEFDRREGWGDGSTQSCAHWLSWKCGIDRGAAREKVRVARALEGLPLISAAMARGELSYSKVRALTRVATPPTEESLLMMALHGTATHVETLVRLYRRAHETCLLEREAVQQANRSVTWFHDDDGSLVLRARLPAEAGAVVVKALELATDLRRNRRPSGIDPDAAPTPPEPDTLTQRRADALALFAETWLNHGYRLLGGGERQQIVIHVDSETLKKGTPGRCEIEEGPSLAAETARRLSCDASLVTLIEDDAGNPLDIGRKTRSIPPAIRRALRSRDTCCRFPGCARTRYLDGHHIQHWADGGATKLSNLVMLCRFHHRQVHEGRIDIRVLDDGALRFTGAGGQSFEAAVATSGDADEIANRNRREGVAIDAETAVTRWGGEGIDYGLAVAGLLDRFERGSRHVPAGTFWSDR